MTLRNSKPGGDLASTAGRRQDRFIDGGVVAAVASAVFAWRYRLKVVRANAELLFAKVVDNPPVLRRPVSLLVGELMDVSPAALSVPAGIWSTIPDPAGSLVAALFSRSVASEGAAAVPVMALHEPYGLVSYVARLLIGVRSRCGLATAPALAKTARVRSYSLGSLRHPAWDYLPSYGGRS